MRAPPEEQDAVGRELVMWVLLPMLNFFFWFSLARSRAQLESCTSSSRMMFLRDMAGVDADGAAHLDLLPPLPCPEVPILVSSELTSTSAASSPPSSPTSSNRIVRHCRTPYPAFPATFLETVPSIEFDEYRGERMASMNYPYDAETVIVKGRKEDVCLSYNHQWTSKEFDSCFAVVRVSAAGAAYPIARFDWSVDENNVDLTEKPDPQYKPKPRFVGNMHNKGRVRPVGFFRKVPKERGFKRVKENPVVW